MFRLAALLWVADFERFRTIAVGFVAGFAAGDLILPDYCRLGFVPSGCLDA
jgi:hypothetical protein